MCFNGKYILDQKHVNHARQDVPQLHFKTSEIDEIDSVSMQIYVNEGFSYLLTKLRLKTKLKSNFNTNKITSFL